MAALIKNINSFCDRLNPGLSAVAVILVVLVMAEFTVKLPAIIQNLNDIANANNQNDPIPTYQ